MTEQLKAIAERIRNAREVLDLTPAQVAELAGMTLEEYLKYESAQVDFSFSAVHNIAQALGIDLTDLFTGESARLTSYVLTRSGEGHSITRNDAYNYKHLAVNFKNKKIEPFYVTLEPDEGAEKEAHVHAGQEFDYILSGRMRVLLAGHELILNEGDSLFYNSSSPHAMYALDGKPVTFIAVVTE